MHTRFAVALLLLLCSAVTAPLCLAQSDLDLDVDFEEVKNVAGALSPSPGGVGPMTIAGLLQNTLRGAQMALGL